MDVVKSLLLRVYVVYAFMHGKHDSPNLNALFYLFCSINSNFIALYAVYSYEKSIT